MRISLPTATVIALAGCAFASIKLPNTTSWIDAGDPAEAARTPSPDFSIGSLTWHVREYAAAPELQPFRGEFNKACAGKRGLDAALCASEDLASHSPFAAPEHEFTDASYDPAADLARHLAGRRGHCMTRSALVADELLSVGIPARVVQVIPRDGEGHNVISVWDERQGWVYVDGSYMGHLEIDGDGASAAEALAAPSRAHFEPVSSSAAPAPFYERTPFDGTVLYPDPWLYLRVGRSAAPWPFRGRFVRIGYAAPTLGPLQNALRVAMLILAMALVAWTGRASLRALSGRQRTTAAPAADDAGSPAVSRP